MPQDAEVITVSALTASVRDLLEHRFPPTWVTGEISNFTPARSGHYYFSLKDATSQVRCVMFRHRNQYLDWQPKEGMQVDVRALVTLYEARGDFQLNVESMRRAGQGALYEAFLKLRDRLTREGLFDDALKRPLPPYPRAIGVVSSLAAAALRDVLSTLARRNPSIPVIVYPSAVQGAGAADELVRAVECAGSRGECDVLILARGGGSIEDLWSFNAEALARAIRACPIPVVSGVGHQTDFTIADFAADVRAPTPTAAAELVSPSREALLDRIDELRLRLAERVLREVEVRMQRLDALVHRLVHPRDAMREQAARLTQLTTRLIHASARHRDDARWHLGEALQRQRAALPRVAELRLRVGAPRDRISRTLSTILERQRTRVDRLAGALEHLSPHKVLERGYSIVTRVDGSVLTDAARAKVGEQVRIDLARGRLDARIDGKSGG